MQPERHDGAMPNAGGSRSPLVTTVCRFPEADWRITHLFAVLSVTRYLPHAEVSVSSQTITLCILAASGTLSFSETRRPSALVTPWPVAVGAA